MHESIIDICAASRSKEPQPANVAKKKTIKDVVAVLLDGGFAANLG